MGGFFSMRAATGRGHHGYEDPGWRLALGGPRTETRDSMWVLAVTPEGSTAPRLEGTDRRGAPTLFPAKPRDTLLKAELFISATHAVTTPGRDGTRLAVRFPCPPLLRRVFVLWQVPSGEHHPVLCWGAVPSGLSASPVKPSIHFSFEVSEIKAVAIS